MGIKWGFCSPSQKVKMSSLYIDTKDAEKGIILVNYNASSDTQKTQISSFIPKNNYTTL